MPALLDLFLGHPSKHGTPGQLYLVLEHAGCDLDQFLKAWRGQNFPPATARCITQRVALALQCLPDQGLLHADVKPANILVKELAPGSVVAKLGDFGSVMEAGVSTYVPSY